MTCGVFREQLDKLICMAEEAEEVLKDSDPVGSPDLNVVQTRIEKLKVLRMVHIRRFVLNVLFNIIFLCVACPLSYIILFQGHLLKLSSLSPDLERVNEMVYRIPVSDRDIKRLQSLNRAWATHSAHLTERFRYQKSPSGRDSNLNLCQIKLPTVGDPFLYSTTSVGNP